MIGIPSVSSIPIIAFINFTSAYLFRSLGLYHSWITDTDYLPYDLEITALSEEGRIMAIRHKIHDIEAVLFHPESIMTPEGKKMIFNWLEK